MHLWFLNDYNHNNLFCPGKRYKPIGSHAGEFMMLQLSLLPTGGVEHIKILDECGLEISVPTKTGLIF